MTSYYLFTQISSNSRYSMFSTSSLFILKSKGLRMNNNKNNKYKKNKQNKAKQKPTKRNNVIIKNYLLLALDLLEALLVLVNLSHPDRKPKQIHLVFCPIGIEIVISIKKHEGSDSNHDIFL